MRPEDIDKLFKERLGNTSPTPPADLWGRLQDRMEAELPQPVAEKKEKRAFMWVYSSVAATLSLLLTVGVVFYNIKSTPEVSDALIQQEKAILKETPITSAPKAEPILESELKTDKISESQATESTAPASKVTETVNRPAAIAKATPPEQSSKVNRSITAGSKPKATVQQAIAQNNPSTDKPADAIAEAAVAKPVASSTLADMNARPVEIIIKRSADPVAAPVVTTEENGLEKKARLAKNIFKQARNLANGEQVELAALGIKAERVALETQIGKQKISKVINL